MLTLTPPPMTLRSHRLSRPRSPRLLPGHTLVQARPVGRPSSVVPSANRKTQQAAWLNGRAARLHRRKLTGRFALGAAIIAIILVSFLASMQSFNPLEQAQMAQSAIATQVTEFVAQVAP